LASRHQKGKRINTVSKRSLIALIFFLAFLFFLILAAGSIRVVVGGSLNGCDISDG
jgi:hypothetical protein